MHRTTKYLSLLVALVVAHAAPGLAQDGAIRKNHFSVDVGVLQGGLSYARRLGQGPFSIGGGVWAAWEPWSTFEGNVWEPLGVELFVRAHPSRDVQLESVRRCFAITGPMIARSAPGRSPASMRRPWWAAESSHWAPHFDSAASRETQRATRLGSSSASRRGCCFPGASKEPDFGGRRAALHHLHNGDRRHPRFIRRDQPGGGAGHVPDGILGRACIHGGF